MLQRRQFRLIVAALAISIAAVMSSLAESKKDQASDVPIPTGPYFGQEAPGNTPKLFAPRVISTGKEHSAAMFTPDGIEIWFGRMFPAKIHFTKLSGGEWTEPQIAPFCDTFNYLYPVLSRDGNKLFFTSDRPLNSNGERQSRGRGGMWVVTRTTDGWTKPEPMDDQINFRSRVSCGSTAANGNLYFAANTTDGSMDIFCSVLVDGVYSDPVSLDDINSRSPDHSPFVAPDESYLIFSSFAGGLGRSDLFISFRQSDGTWATPKTLGARINSAYKDEYPYVTADGKYLFFNSNRPSSLNESAIPDGPGNIYWVDADIIDRLREEHFE